MRQKNSASVDSISTVVWPLLNYTNLLYFWKQRSFFVKENILIRKKK